MLRISRKLLLVCAALFASVPVHASDWPQKPVKIVVPQAAGNSPDVWCRIIADKLSRALGQQFVVENMPGAANAIGTQAVASAEPDGYTFLFATSASLVTNPYTFKNLAYDPMKDFRPVAMVARSQQLLLAHPSVKATSLPELIALEKAAPGSLSIAVTGPRNLAGLIAQSINKQAGIDLKLVSYNSNSQSVQDILTGRTPLALESMSVVVSFVKEGTLRPIAVTGNRRIASLPDVASISETLQAIDLEAWFMIMAPAGTPDAIVTKLSEEIVKALKDEDVLKQAPALGFDADVGDAATSLGAQKFLDAQYEAAGKVIRSLGIEPK